MKNFLIAFSVFLVWSFFGLWLYSWFESEEKILNKASEIAENNVADSTKPTLENDEPIDIDFEEGSIISKDSLSTSEKVSEEIISEDIVVNYSFQALNEDGDIIFKFSEGTTFKKNSADVIVSKSAIDYKYKINSYLLEHPDKEVQINSLYGASENFDSPNLGVQRGEKIKKALVEIGIPAEKIVIKPVIKGIDFDENNIFKNSISFSFKPLDEERISDLKTKLPEPKIVYPRFSNSGILINQNLKNLFTEIKELSKNNPDLKVEIIGHTDNIGNSIDNYKMGLNYAKQVLWYLTAKGAIDKANIKSTSRGEEEPIDTNNSERGRNANRRIEVIFY